MNKMQVPLVNLVANYNGIKSEIDRAIAKVVASGSFILNDVVADFESQFATYCDSNYSVGVASGTDALYPIFVYTGLLFWQFFSSALSDTSNVLINNQSIITKVYFPRLLLPLSSVATKFIDFIIASIILVGMMIYYGYTPHLYGLLIIPLLLFITFMASVGLGLFLASINVKYRDVRYALPFFIQILMFVTPVIYPAGVLGKYSWILALNPMMGVIQSARAALLGTTVLNWTLIIISFIATFVLLLIGIYVFKKTERYFADII
jgi:lipopolysaccharide transport system permease protein